ncbi:MAG: beta/gamma crystallin-related protein [Chloroflexi bacterium]|nr:beta/gamma crystallin-related protein [Chloroflexota bacterium]
MRRLNRIQTILLSLVAIGLLSVGTVLFAGMMPGGSSSQLSGCAGMGCVFAGMEGGGTSSGGVPLKATLIQNQISNRLDFTNDIPDLNASYPGWNDKAFYVYVYENAEVALYEYPGYQGKCVRLAGAGEHSLAGTPVGAGTVSSVRIGKFGECGGLRLFEHFDYQGQSIMLDYYGGITDLASVGFNDKASSAIVYGNVQWSIYSEANFTGACTSLTGLIPRLDAYGVGSDRASSAAYSGMAEVMATTCGNNIPSLTLYSDNGFAGAQLILNSDIPDLAALGYNDRASSAKSYWMGGGPVASALYSNSNHTGTCTAFSGDMALLNNTLVGNDSVSSVKLRVGCPELASTPGAASWGSAGRTDLFGTANDRTLWHRWSSNGVWGGFEHMGGGIVGNTAIAARGGNKWEVIVRGDDNGFFRRTWDGSTWSNYIPFGPRNGSDPANAAVIGAGGGVNSDPATVAWDAGRLDVLYRGGNNHLWHLGWNGSNWSTAADLGGGLTAAPSVSSWGQGRLDVFAKGDNNGLWQKSYDGQWRDWYKVNGENTMSSAPAAVSWGSARLDVFSRAPDGKLRHDWWPGTGGWLSEFLDSGLEGAPTVSSPGSGKLDVFYRKAGQGNTVFRQSFNGSWQAPAALP